MVKKKKNKTEKKEPSMSTTIGILDFYRLDVSTRDSNSVIEIP